MTLKVNEPNDAYKAMEDDWAMVDALMGGTNAMRKAGEKLLPRFEMECEEDYQKRLACATLFPAYSETVGNMTGRVFYRPINRDNVNEKLTAITEDADLQGNDLDVFAASWFEVGLSHGLCHVLVDYPKVQDLASRADGVLTQGDLKGANVRPYARLVTPQDLIGWRIESINNVNVVTQVRIAETREVADGEYGTKTFNCVRVIEPGRYQLWQEGEKEWELIEEGARTFSEIPLVTFYTKRTGILTAKPPMLELAHLNVKHWQEQSDQDASVRFARVRMVYATGLDPDTKLSASAESIIALPQGATMDVVQGSAESVKVGSDSLDTLERQMREAGAKLLVKNSATTKTVVQARSDSVVEQSALGRMAQGLEDAIDQVLDFMAKFEGIESGGHADVNDDFDAFDDETSMKTIVEMNAAGIISDETAFNEAKRRGIVSNELEWDAEQERIRSSIL